MAPETCTTPVVVIPVFNAVPELARCLDALRATLPSNARVLIIDDASTDPAVAETLAMVPSHWEVLRQSENRGFVATANRGIGEAGDADVVLLNSDTVPAGDWLARIAVCAASDPAIASITPWTNNGEIASLPDFCRAAPIPDDPEAWARACAGAGPPEYPEIPTAVGFCMYLRRACIERIGAFDEQAFGRGYGEENDWCMRATKAGWRHVLCDDAFVAHAGNASFGPLGLKPGDEAMRALLKRHPDYLDIVRDFIDRDPLARVRERILEQMAR
ncbi:MAG: glycosyltransferase [Wenzhouxiangellaceae bacterium]|nr:glycosyltransferase [Wenzhouxiangellaceae bacterium]